MSAITEVSDPDKKTSGSDFDTGEQTIDFEGVSFRYDGHTFGDVEWKVVPDFPLAQADFKPDNVAPRHVLFTFELGRENTKAIISVYPLNDFPDAYSKSPEQVGYMKEKIEGLKKVLSAPAFRVDDEIPHLPYRDTSENFYVKVKEFDFENGDGILFVTHWTHGSDLVSNRNLLYRYEGITRDGNWYVTAETPISVDFLPDDSPAEFEGYTYENLYGFGGDKKAAEKRFDTYIESISSRLSRLESGSFSPNLHKFEAMIESLRIQK